MPEGMGWGLALINGARAGKVKGYSVEPTLSAEAENQRQLLLKNGGSCKRREDGTDNMQLAESSWLDSSEGIKVLDCSA